MLIQFKQNHKLLIIATTTQKSILEQMEFGDYFNAAIYIPNITNMNEVDSVVKVTHSRKVSLR